MDTTKISICQYSERSVLIHFNQKCDEKLLYLMLDYKNKLLNNTVKLILDIYISYNSLLVNYITTINDFYDAKNDLLKLFAPLSSTKDRTFRKVILPVCYDQEFGIDLEHVSKHCHIEISEIIKRHSETEYLVYFIGFLPGFPYLLNLPKKLYCPRRNSPREKIKKGAVGIGGNQTGIYPQSSPGGWQILGNCPIPIFDDFWPDKVLLRPTDILSFQPVDIDNYHQIKSDFKNDNYQLNIETCATD